MVGPEYILSSLICKKCALDKSYRDPEDTYYVLYSICTTLILRFTDIDNEIVIWSPVHLIYSRQQPDVSI
jgi:hypothetical protein